MQNTAILVIDMQNDFVKKDGAACVNGAEKTIPAISHALSWCREHGILVVHVIRSHKADGSDVEIFRRERFKNGQGICLENSYGAEIVQELRPLPGDHTIIKKRFSAFYHTELETLLRQHDIHTLLLAGTQYPNCVRGSAADALYRDFQVIVLTDCCSAQNDDIAQSNIQDMRNMGIVCIPLESLESL